MNVHDEQDLEWLVKEPAWADTHGESALLLDLRGANINATQAAEANAWLSALPIPVVGLINSEIAILTGLDLVTHSEEAFQEYARAIAHQPDAAAILVQVTRETAGLSLRAALILESLAYSSLLGGRGFRRWHEANTFNPPDVSDHPVLVDRNDKTLRIQLNRPQARNAIGMVMRDALAELFQLVLRDPGIELAVVTGAGPDFSAGGDLREFGLADDLAEAHRVRQLRMPGQFVGMVPGKFRFELHGACVGGGIEIPAFAGQVVAHADTWFQLPEVGFGLIPGAGGCVSIPRRIGRHRTNALALTGRKLDAGEALAWGLIDGIC